MSGEKHKTIKDVASLAKVSTATVSRVLNGTGAVHPKTGERVRQALDQLGYVPNGWAQAMAVTNGINLIGMVVPDIQNPFFAAIYAGVSEQVRKHGMIIWMGDSADDPAQEGTELYSLQRYRPRGIVLTPAHPDHNLPAIDKMSTPICLVDRRLAVDKWDLVLIDNKHGAHQAANTLIGAGHRDMAIIAGPQDTTPGRERFQGFSEALEEAGLELPPEYIGTGDFRESSGYRIGRELLALDHPPTAIFSSNNLMTMGLLEAIQATPHASLGETVSVVGFDDLPISTFTTPPLTVVSRPMKEMGIQAGRLILDRMDHPARAKETIILMPHLVIRGSERLAPVKHRV